MRTTVNINDALLARAKLRAVDHGVTLGSYMEEALRQRLAATREESTPINLPTFDGGTAGGLRAGIDPSSNRHLYEALDEQPDTAA